MRTLILFLTLLFLSPYAFIAYAQTPITVELWQDGAPNSNGVNGPEREIRKNRWTDITVPTLTIYPAQHSNGIAVISCPGGAYVYVALDYEAHDMAAWYNAQGITYAVLKYRLPNGHPEVPLSDVQQALRYMRKHAAEWNVRKIGLQGASAGGHLASTAATHYKDKDTRPDFQILLYPAIRMSGGATKNLLGEHPSQELIDCYSNDKQVTPDTPTAFIMHCQDDSTVSVKNSIDYYSALVAHRIPANLHIYQSGGHGWGYKDSMPYKRQWTGELEKWLRDLSQSLSQSAE